MNSSDRKIQQVAEMLLLKDLLDTYPTGIISIVSDTFNLWDVCVEYLPRLKKKILTRDGKLVIRPDSGDPVDILCGDIQPIDNGWYTKANEREYLYYDEMGEYCSLQSYYQRVKDTSEYNTSKGVIELLWDEFGGTVNEQGYKILDSHIGAIYGDSITHERAEEICRRLEAKGFASTNVVFGIGSFTYQHNTRDTFGHAMKATYVEKTTIQMNGYPQEFKDEIVQGFEIYKDPITDDGLKKSAKGLMVVYKTADTNDYFLVDGASWDDVRSEQNQLKVVFKDGQLTKRVTLEEIRKKLY